MNTNGLAERETKRQGQRKGTRGEIANNKKASKESEKKEKTKRRRETES